MLDFLLFIKEKTRKKFSQSTIESIPQNSPFLNFIDQLETDLPAQEEDELPSDFPKNLDHYLYGLAKEAE